MAILKLIIWLILLMPLAISDWKCSKVKLYLWLGPSLLVNLYWLYAFKQFSWLLICFNLLQIAFCLFTKQVYFGIGLADWRLLTCAIFYFNWQATASYLLISCLLIVLYHLYLKLSLKEKDDPKSKLSASYPLLPFFALANGLELIYQLALLII